MTQFLTTSVGRLRLIAFLEGISLIILVFIGVPMKYYMGNPSVVTVLGPIHGVLFLLFVFNAFQVAAELKWRFTETTWKVLLASIIPFGTFYIDNRILRKIKAG